MKHRHHLRGRCLDWRRRTLAIGIWGIHLWAGGLMSEALAVDEVRLRGTVEVSVHPFDQRALTLNTYNRGDTPFDLTRFRLFVDAAPAPRMQILTQFRFDDALPNGFTLAGAYLLYELLPKGQLYLETGKIPSPFGTFAERDYADQSALIGTPLMYFFHSTLLSRAVPANEGELLSVRGRGQFGVDYPSVSGPRFRGTPILYSPCWDIGAVLLGAAGDFEYRMGAIAGTPGVPSVGRESNDLPSLIGRFGWAPRPWARVGASGSAGPYLPSAVAGSGAPVGYSAGSGAVLPEGRVAEDYWQVLWGADLETSHGHWTLWAEAVHNSFESPWIRRNLSQNAFYVELRRRIAPGLEAALRWDQIRPGKIEGSDGEDVRWDVPVQRLEIGSAYHFSRELQVKANLQMTGFGLRASSIGDEVLTSLQVVGSF